MTLGIMVTLSMESKFDNNVFPDPRTTDDHFLIEISVSEVTGKLKNILKNSGAVEINIIDSKEH